MASRHAKSEAVIADVPAPRELPLVTFAADGCVMGHWHGISIVVWATQATGELMGELEKLSDSLIAVHPRVSTVHLAVKGAPLPTSEARARLSELLQRYANNLVCAATVIQGSGFWASAIRSLITSMQMIERFRFETRTFAELADVADWVAPLQQADTGEPVDARELERALLWMLEQERGQLQLNRA